MSQHYSKLNIKQVARFAEIHVREELIKYGFKVTDSENRGIDFNVRFNQNPMIEVQVRSLRTTHGYIFNENYRSGYSFILKENFELCEHRYWAFALLIDLKPPELYLIPSLAWKTTNRIFSAPDYIGKKSQPEWGLTVSADRMSLLKPYSFDGVIKTMMSKN